MKDPKRVGIPTVYASTRFRSRVEARWAAFFDLVGWPWTYEPYDLDGWIPDFSLDFHGTIVVEVKSDGADLNEARVKIGRSGWEGEALLCTGQGPTALRLGRVEGDCSVVTRGPRTGVIEHEEERSFQDDEATVFECRVCKKISIEQTYMLYGCRVTGCYSKGAPDADVSRMWREAGNVVQWRKP